MRKHVARVVTAVALLAGAFSFMPPAHAVEPDPVLDKAVFNDPVGTVAQQNAIFSQLARLIDRVPAGEEIQMSIYDFTLADRDDLADAPDLVDRLLNARSRGVRVKVVIDQASANASPHTRLKAALGAIDTATSYIVVCNDKFPTQRRGCIGTRAVTWSNGTTYAYNHNKFTTFTKVVLNNGTAVSNVVYQASSNQTIWDTNEAYNNAFTYSDAGTFAAYRTYFEDLRRYRANANGNNNYYWTTPSGTPYKLHVFPRQERAGTSLDDPATDTVYNILESIKSCSYKDEAGVTRQTDVRIAMWSFTRPELAKKLTALRKAGCWVDVVGTDISATVMAQLNVAGGPQITRCNFNVGPGLDIRVHSKYMLIDGAYDDDIVPRVFTGSHNYGYSPLRQADETLLRIMGRGTHDDYLRNFWQVRDTCRARGGVIR